MKRSTMLGAGLLAIGMATACGRSSAEGQAAPSQQTENVAAARKLLTSWRGQTEVLDQAEALLSEELGRNPTNHLALKEMARWAMMSGNGAQLAEQLDREALRIKPDFAEGYVLLGHILAVQRRLPEAEESLRKAEALGTKDPWLELNWAAIMAAKGDLGSAAARAEFVVQGRSKDLKAMSTAYEWLIKYAKRTGPPQKVVELYKAEIETDPGNPLALGDYAMYLTGTLGRHDEAITHGRAAMKIHDCCNARRGLSLALYGKWADLVADGQSAAAAPYFDEALVLMPELNDVMGYGAAQPSGGNLARALVAKGVSIDSQVQDDDSTALLIATNLQNTNTVNRLLQMGANPNIASSSGLTPLFSAAEDGSIDIVKALLAHGADRATKVYGYDAAGYAERQGRAEVAETIRTFKN